MSDKSGGPPFKFILVIFFLGRNRIYFMLPLTTPAEYERANPVVAGSFSKMYCDRSLDPTDETF